MYNDIIQSRNNIHIIHHSCHYECFYFNDLKKNMAVVYIIHTSYYNNISYMLYYVLILFIVDKL